MDLEIGTLIIRGTNLVLWIAVAARVLIHDQTMSRLARRSVTTVIVFGMAVLFIGALVPFGFPGKSASFIYTAFTAYSGILAIVLLSTGEPNGRDQVKGEDDAL